ncbi:hypothetical protein CANCADRAFT_970 [Tortispora caseinolytica NRRL Y-17796]|uniref:acetyl-CoA C-acetyltransferase n=1 Tax=Tortispora caseinolytica NRRL Y-17796 TaxID=767744 RepID=A0A1E4TKV8_9ASCO|nr:hypothetical protein CANCADRAFT_970 [Tortispora caseinolytica NRRL Y-17796]
MVQPVYIVSYARTPIGRFMGQLAPLSATDLGGAAAKAALEKVPQIPLGDIDEVIFGNVMSANVGQAPARQIAHKAGLPDSVPATTLNKVCASGMKAAIVGAQSIICGSDIVLVGGAESMTNVPYYSPSTRSGARFGGTTLVDGLDDGLQDAYDKVAMGVFAEETAAEYKITREQQDDFSIRSFKRAQAAYAEKKLEYEIAPITVPGRKPITVTVDENLSRLDEEKLRAARPAFSKDPSATVTAPNSSALNDGAAALVLVSERKLKELNLTPIAKIIGWGDAEQRPQRFTTAPSLAVPKAIKHAGLTPSDINFYELNEAFAVVGLANCQILNLKPEQVNVYGGAVAIGHPLGCSGARIICTLATVLTNEGGKYGVAGVCNGGGGASAIVLERITQSGRL